MSESIFTQEAFLEELQSSGKEVKIFLVNGFQIQGKVLGSDKYMLFISSANNQQQYLYKSVVSTILVL